MKALAILAVVLALGVTTVSADPEKATLTATVGDTEYTVTGSGFEPDSPVYFNVSDPSCCSFFTTWSDADGNIEVMLQSWLQGGVYLVEAYERNNGGHLLLSAEVTVTIP